MRADMAKVIVERPRLKGWAWKKPKGYARQLRRYDQDGPPRREGIKQRWNRTKALNEHLGPLRRYLDKQVGRPWNKVYSEICAHIDRNSAVQDHVRDHVDQYVATHVILIDGVPCDGGHRYGSYGLPLHQLRYRPWYVCPRTGLLRRVKRVSRKRQCRPREESLPPYFRVGADLQCRFLDGAWHLVTLKPLPAPDCNRQHCRERDILLDRPASEITEEEARKRYGAPVFAVAKSRLARRKLKQYPIPVDLWI
jgi:hypothetical protein